MRQMRQENNTGDKVGQADVMYGAGTLNEADEARKQHREYGRTGRKGDWGSENENRKNYAGSENLSHISRYRASWSSSAKDERIKSREKGER